MTSLQQMRRLYDNVRWIKIPSIESMVLLKETIPQLCYSDPSMLEICICHREYDFVHLQNDLLGMTTSCHQSTITIRELYGCISQGLADWQN